MVKLHIVILFIVYIKAMGREVNMRKIGYVRVNTRRQLDENYLEQQQKQLLDDGCTEIVIKEIPIGKKIIDKPKLHELINVLVTGDTLFITTLSKIARTIKEGITLIEELSARGITVKILNFGDIEGGLISSNKLMT